MAIRRGVSYRAEIGVRSTSKSARRPIFPGGLFAKQFQTNVGTMDAPEYKSGLLLDVPPFLRIAPLLPGGANHAFNSRFAQSVNRTYGGKYVSLKAAGYKEKFLRLFDVEFYSLLRGRLRENAFYVLFTGVSSNEIEDASELTPDSSQTENLIEAVLPAAAGLHSFTDKGTLDVKSVTVTPRQQSLPIVRAEGAPSAPLREINLFNLGLTDGVTTTVSNDLTSSIVQGIINGIEVDHLKQVGALTLDDDAEEVWQIMRLRELNKTSCEATLNKLEDF